MIFSDYHVHTAYCDGKSTPEEIVTSAIKKGMTHIGFSGHSYTFFDESYCMSKEATKEYISSVRYSSAFCLAVARITTTRLSRTSSTTLKSGLPPLRRKRTSSMKISPNWGISQTAMLSLPSHKIPTGNMFSLIRIATTKKKLSS